LLVAERTQEPKRQSGVVHLVPAPVVPGIGHPFCNVTAVRVSVTDLSCYRAESLRGLLAPAEEGRMQIPGHETNLGRG